MPCPHHFGPGACHECAGKRVDEAMARLAERRAAKFAEPDETKAERRARLARMSDEEWEAQRT